MNEAHALQDDQTIKIRRTAPRVYKPKDVGTILGFSESIARKFIEKVHKDTTGKYFVVLKVSTMYKVPMKQFDDWFDSLSSKEVYDIQTMFDDDEE